MDNNKQVAEKQEVFESGTRSGPTKNIANNCFGDAVFKLAGGDIIRKALDGDVKAQGQLFMGALSSLGGGARKPNIGDDAAKTTSKFTKIVVLVYPVNRRNSSLF